MQYANPVERRILKKAIYKITNIINGKIYIGQSINPTKRFQAHKSRARNHDYSSSQALYRAMNKYGEENFVLDILEWTEDYNQREKDFIKDFGTLSPNGYNIATGGEEPPHLYGKDHPKCVVTEEQVDKIIYELKRAELTEPLIGRLFDPPINLCLINNINFGITHKRNNESYPIRKQFVYNLNREELCDIIWLLKNTTCTMNEISDYFGFNVSTIKAINSGRNHFDPNIDYPIRKNRGNKNAQSVETILANRSTLAIDTQVEMGICK